MEQYILTVDQSTSTTKVMLFDCYGNMIKKLSKNHMQYYPKPGWVEHDPNEIYENTILLIKQLLSENAEYKKSIKCISITNQRESVILWDKNTGKAVYNVIVWQCNRGVDICKNLQNNGFDEIIKSKTGLNISPYFSASKIKWILDNNKDIKQKAEKGDIAFGTIDSWLIWKLTNGKIHATDYSNASRTMLFNINTLKWDEDIFRIFDIPIKMAPEVLFSDDIFGKTNIENILENEIPITGVIGDSHAALFGHGCFEKGLLKATYGTGSSVMMNVGEKNINSKKLVSSIGWGIKNQITYVLEGNINYSGATIKWFIDKLELNLKPSDFSDLAQKVDSTNGVYVIPAFVGLAAPYWRSDAKGAIIGLNADTKIEHIARAVEESIAFQIKDIVEQMKLESGYKIEKLYVDGGAINDIFLMQFQANILDIPVYASNINEISGLGSALVALLALKILKDTEEIKKLIKEGNVYFNKMGKNKREILYEGWKNAIAKVIG